MMITIPMLYSKLHRATVTGADLHYEGSIAIDQELIAAAKLRPLQMVEIYNINNGERFSTYVIAGAPGEISLNGAAARRVQKGDLLIICAYAQVDLSDANSHTARIVLLGEGNTIEKSFDAEASVV
jgi:aspartate 1-decarboxylase